MSWVSYHPSMVFWNHPATSFGHNLWSFFTSFDWWNSSLIGWLLWPVARSLHLLAWSVISCVQTGSWGRCVMLDLRRTEGHRLSSWEFLIDKFGVFLCWMVCCIPITGRRMSNLACVLLCGWLICFQRRVMIFYSSAKIIKYNILSVTNVVLICELDGMSLRPDVPWLTNNHKCGPCYSVFVTK
jgi:hypothetical protein